MNFFRRKKAECKTSADVRAALDEATEQRQARQARLAEVRHAREAILLDGDAAAARRNKSEIADAESDVEQCEAWIRALHKSLEETVAAEASAALDREIEICRAEHREGVDLVRGEYAAAVAKIVGVLERLREIERRRLATKKTASAAGVLFAVPPVEADACSSMGGNFRAIADFVTLPDAANSARNAWGPGPSGVSTAGAPLGNARRQAGGAG